MSHNKWQNTNRILSSLHIFPILLTVFLQFPTRQSFALLPHFILCLAFPSTYQILKKQFLGLLSLQEQFLNFSMSIIFGSLFSNHCTFPLFLFLFFSTLTSAGTAIPAIIPFCSFLPITIRSDHLAFSRLSHWIFMSNSTFVSQFSTAPSRACSPQFHCVLTHSFYKYSNELSFQHCSVFFCICFETIFHTPLLCVAHFHLFSHTIYTKGLSLILLMWYFI